MTLIVPPEPAWIATLEAPRRRMLRAFLRAGPRANSFWAGPGGVTPADAGVYMSRGLDLRSYAVTTEVVPHGDGLPARVRLTGGQSVNEPASLFSTPNGRAFDLGLGFGTGTHRWRMGLPGNPTAAPVSPMRGAVLMGWGTVGVGTLPTAAATGFGYDLGRGDSAQWYAQTRAASDGPAATRIPLGEFGMTLLGGEEYSHWMLAERGVRAIHVIIYRHDTNQAWGHAFTDADGLPAPGVFGYLEPLASSGGEEGTLTPRITEFCEIRGYLDGSFMEAA